jgi:hypothetical protein
MAAFSHSHREAENNTNKKSVVREALHCAVLDASLISRCKLAKLKQAGFLFFLESTFTHQNNPKRQTAAVCRFGLF